MIKIRSKLIVYALLSFSFSIFLNSVFFAESLNMYLSRYFLYNSRQIIFCTDFLKTEYYFPKSDVKKTTEIKNEPYDASDNVEENVYLSKDKNVVLSNQKCTGLAFSNETNYVIDPQSMLFEKPDIKFADNNEPQILIVHTHASESYGYKRTHPLTDTDRTQDKEYNMVRVGRELKNELKKRGYNVLHDETVHDYPSYTSSYKRSGETVERYLNKYPSIFAVFDIHRDAIINDDGKNVGLVSMQNGEECAQVMIVCGTDQNNLKFDLWEENLRLAFKIQDYMQSKYPGIMRNINIRKERFNLHLTKGSLLFEIGTNGNSLNQALNSVKYLADGIDKTLQNISKSY